MRFQWVGAALLALAVFLTLIAPGCFEPAGPTDEEIVQAVQHSPVFMGGVRGFTLRSPIVVVQKGGRTKNGYWTAKVKFTLTYTKSNGSVSVPVESTSDFRLFRTEGADGKVLWRAELGT